MKFLLSTQELNYLINKIQNVVGQKPTIPILSNFLIEAFNDTITLTATDLSVGIRCNTEAKIIEEGATTLPAKYFAQLIRELTAPNTEITSNAKEITTIIAGTSRFKLNGMSKNEFPSLPDMSEAQSFLIKQSVLKDLIYRSSFAVSKVDERFTLTGVCMQIANSIVTFTATDGKRLARVQTPIDIDSTFTNQSIIPTKAVEEILKNLREEGDAKVYILQDKIAVEANNTIVVSKLLAGEYPDVSVIIPKHAETILNLHREEMISLLRQMSLFITDQDQSVRFSFSDGEVKILANTTHVGEGDVAMPVNYQGPKLDIAFNPINFLDILRHCKSETVLMGFTDPYNPSIFTDGNDLSNPHQVSPLFLLMPMRCVGD